MGWLSSFLHPERGYKKAEDSLQKYFQMAQQYQQPFVNNSNEAYGGLSEALKNLLNPQQLQDQWSKGYNESDYAKNLESEATNRGLNAASSLGLNGSSSALQAIQRGTSQIGAQDRNQYLNDLMQKYLSGIGLGQNIYGVGANAAGQLGQNALNTGQNQAQLEFGKQNAPGDLFSKLLEGGASLGVPYYNNFLTKKFGNNNNQWNLTGVANNAA